MRTVVVVLAFFWPALSSAAPCSFVLGEATLRQGDRGNAEGEWFTVSGRAELSVSGKGFEARLFDDRGRGDMSHRLWAKWSSRRAPNERTFSGRVRTYGSDAGDLSVTGAYSRLKSKDGAGPYVTTSLVGHNAGAFVAITCFEQNAS